MSDPSTTKRAALYMRVSTAKQDPTNQRQALERTAAQRGWKIVKVYEDVGISGAKARDKRPGLNAMLMDATRGEFDVVMSWSVDRVGRSLQDLVGILQELQGAGVGLFLYQQALDTTTPAGMALFQMSGVFAEFERAIIQERVNAGLARARAETREQRLAKGKQIGFGHPKVALAVERAIKAGLAEGKGILKVARELGVGSSTVQRVRRAASQEAACIRV